MKQLQFSCTLYFYAMTLKTVLRCRAALGWTFRGSVYCQLIRQQNKVKRLQWAQEHLSKGVAATGRESFFIVSFSDESFCGRFIQQLTVLELSVHFV